MVKNYGIHDEWKDLNKVNDIDIKSVDGVIDSIKVNGEEAGGGGDIWQIAFNPTQYKIEGLQGEYELQDGGHSEYGTMIPRNTVPDEITSDNYFTEEFTININGTDYVLKPYFINDSQYQDAGDYNVAVTMAPSAEDENILVYMIGINIISDTPVTSVAISCPDITIATPTEDAESLAALLTNV